MNMKLKRIAINFAVFACFASSVFAGNYEFSGGFPTQETIQKARTIPIQFSLGEGLDIGQDVGSPVDFTYKLPFKFTGKIEKVQIDLK